MALFDDLLEGVVEKLTICPDLKVNELRAISLLGDVYPAILRFKYKGIEYEVLVKVHAYLHTRNCYIFTCTYPGVTGVGDDGKVEMFSLGRIRDYDKDYLYLTLGEKVPYELEFPIPPGAKKRKTYNPVEEDEDDEDYYYDYDY